MYTADALRDMLERTHRSLVKLMNHCRVFSGDELHREIDGFGFPTIQLQLHHMIGAQRYWIGVLEGRIDADEDQGNYPTIDTLEVLRLEILGLTRRYLDAASPEELNTPRAMVTWGDQEKTLTPAHVVLRTLTHIYQHQGQVAAMSRLLGQPIPPGLDFPLLDA